MQGWKNCEFIRGLRKVVGPLIVVAGRLKLKIRWYLINLDGKIMQMEPINAALKLQKLRIQHQRFC